MAWSVGVGPLLAERMPEYAEDPMFLGGYTGVGVDPKPDDDDGLEGVAYADTVDPYTMILQFTVADDYAYYVPVADAAALASGDARGLTPAWYHVLSYWVLEVPPEE